jgi:hypothetical protein
MFPDSSALADLPGERVEPHVRVEAAVERRVPERLDRPVELGGHLRDPGRRDVLDSERAD